MSELETTARRAWLGDKVLALVVAGLLCSGLIMVYSASALGAEERYGNALRYVSRQGAGICAGLVCVALLQLISIETLRRYVWWLFALGLIGLSLVFVPGLGHRAYAASRWISLGGVNIQPSEFAKIALILVLAHHLALNEGRLGDLAVAFLALVIPIPVVLLLMAEPDFGTTVITVTLTGVMLFIAGLQWRYALGLGGLMMGLLLFVATLAPYRMRRLLSFWDPFKDPEGSGYQVIQGWIAMGSGGWTGQGIATGVAKRGGLPEAHNDFIAAIVAEELGALGWVVLILLYVVLIWRGFHISVHAKDLFSTLMGAAITTMLATQVIINMGVVVGWLPSKGLVLPFMSYGASAIVAYLICIGLLLRISSESSAQQNGYAAPLGGQ
jgi:cell division protein FtsW